MQVNQAIKKSIEESVLCWLATSSADNMPNVSPKEVFTHFAEKYIIIANIASPQSLRNIQENPQVCISFIDIFVQKGFQIKGRASVIKKSDKDYGIMEEQLLKITQGKFPFNSITKIQIENTKPIIAPKYILYPKTTESQQIKSAMKVYQVMPKS